MLTYEQSKKLKDMGFPQEWETTSRKEALKAVDLYFKQRAELVHIPTLGELIEACGEKFYGVINYKKSGWVADHWHESEEKEMPKEYFKTPDEAVMNLYAKLHGKPHPRQVRDIRRKR